MMRRLFSIGIAIFAAGLPASGEVYVVGDRGPLGVLVRSLEFDRESGYLWAVDDQGALWLIDPATGTSGIIGDTGFPGVESLTLDPELGILYGLHAGTLLAIDPTSGATVPIGQTGQPGIRELAFDRESRDLYAVQELGPLGYAESILLDVDEASGVSTTIGTLSGLDGAHYVTGLAFDEGSGTLYGSASSFPGGGVAEGLFRIDPILATATFIGDNSSYGVTGLTLNLDEGVLIGYSGQRLVEITASSGVARSIRYLAAGADFGDLAPAIDAAQAGDTILLLPGSYGLELDKGVRILGSPLGQVRLNGSVDGVPAGESAVISGVSRPNLRVTGCEGVVVISDVSRPSLYVDGCDGLVVVVVEDLGSSKIGIDDSSDVRLRGVRIQGGSGGYDGGTALYVDDSRLEVVNSEVAGGHGGCYYFGKLIGWDCGTGGSGLRATNSFVHIALSDVAGGLPVPDPPIGVPFQGIGLMLLPGSEAVVAGTPDDITLGAWISGPLRYSGVPPIGPSIFPGGSVSAPVDPDPTLELVESTLPGTPLVFRVHGTPGASVVVLLGAEPTLLPAASFPIAPLLLPIEQYDLGVIASNGEASLLLSYPPWWADGGLLLAQAEVTHPDGQFLRSNSVVVPLAGDVSLLLASALLGNVLEETTSLPASSVTNQGNQQALSNFIAQAQAHVETGNITLALNRLQKAMERTDGCALRGSPDVKTRGAGPAVDYVVTCVDQARLYPVLQTVINTLENRMTVTAPGSPVPWSTR